MQKKTVKLHNVHFQKNMMQGDSKEKSFSHFALQKKIHLKKERGLYY